jgi:hypothetical protein
MDLTLKYINSFFNLLQRFSNFRLLTSIQILIVLIHPYSIQINIMIHIYFQQQRRISVGIHQMLDHQHISVLQLLQVYSHSFYILLNNLFLLDDPWSSETNGRNSANTTPKDPWLTTTQANPWNGNNHTTTNNNNTGLSVNIADPWGLGTSNSQTTTSPPTASKTIDNELSEFFGANAGKISCGRFYITSFLQLFQHLITINNNNHLHLIHGICHHPYSHRLQITIQQILFLHLIVV